MLNMEEWMEIRSLRSDGHSIKAIARMTGRSRNTVRRAIREKGPRPFHQEVVKRSILDPFKEYLKRRFAETALSAIRLIQEIRPMGYKGSVATLRRFLEPMRHEAGRKKKLTVRFETAPGKQAQVDWGYCGRFTDTSGNKVSIYAFIMVLGFSRMMYVELTTSMATATLIRSHINAFAFFGGWPRELLLDNMKQVRLSQVEWNPLFLDFANHYGLSVVTHRVRRPRTKGKVERMVGYVKNNFLNGRSFASLDDLNAEARHWLSHTANSRMHATTGQVPLELLKAEGLTLVTSTVPYQLNETVVRRVNWEGFVQFCRSRYSVPPECAGKSVVVGLRDGKVIIRSGDMIVAEHESASKPNTIVATRQHIEKMWRLSMDGSDSAVPPRWSLTFDQSVHSRPLTAYEEATV